MKLDPGAPITTAIGGRKTFHAAQQARGGGRQLRLTERVGKPQQFDFSLDARTTRRRDAVQGERRAWRTQRLLRAGLHDKRRGRHVRDCSSCERERHPRPAGQKFERRDIEGQPRTVDGAGALVQGRLRKFESARQIAEQATQMRRTRQGGAAIVFVEQGLHRLLGLAVATKLGQCIGFAERGQQRVGIRCPRPSRRLQGLLEAMQDQEPPRIERIGARRMGGEQLLNQGLGARQLLGARLDTHLRQPDRPSALRGIATVVRDPNHLKAFALAGLMMFSGFTIIPYITIFLQANVGVKAEDIPYVYLVGGGATLFTARWFGRVTDRVGKVVTFRRLVGVAIVPLVGLTLLGPVPLGVVLIVSTLFFVFQSGRMIPGMAILTSAVKPQLRGTYMTLLSSVQSAGMGLAALVGGQLISRDAQGHVLHYWVAALVGAMAGLTAIWLVGKITLHGAVAKPMVGGADAKT